MLVFKTTSTANQPVGATSAYHILFRILIISGSRAKSQPFPVPNGSCSGQSRKWVQGRGLLRKKRFSRGLTHGLRSSYVRLLLSKFWPRCSFDDTPFQRKRSEVQERIDAREILFEGDRGCGRGIVLVAIGCAKLQPLRHEILGANPALPNIVYAAYSGVLIMLVGATSIDQELLPVNLLVDLKICAGRGDGG